MPLVQLNLDEVKKARELLAGLNKRAYQNSFSIKSLDPKTILALQKASNLAYSASATLTNIGFVKLEAIREHLQANRYSGDPISGNAGYPSVFSQMETLSTKPVGEISRDDLEIGARVLTTYMGVMPWVEEVRKQKTIQGLARILEENI